MKKKSEQAFSNHNGASGVGWIDPKTGKLPLNAYIEGVQKSPTADDAILKLLVWNFEEIAAEKGCDAALKDFWERVDRLHREGTLTINERELLIHAEVAGALDVQGLFSDLKYIRAVQELVKANADVLRLPFIQNAMISLLRAQKYGGKPRDMRDIWGDFLTKRPKKKIMHSTESLGRLLRAAKDNGIKAVDAPAVIGNELGISEDTIKKLTHGKDCRPGRPKKSR